MVYNNLFNEKKMEEFIELYDSNLVINSPNEDPVCDWIKKLNNNELEDEKKNYANFLVIILERLLGYKIEDIAYETDPGSEGRPVEFTFKKGEKEYVVVELKGTKTKDLNKRYNRSQSAIEQVTNYASIKEETQWAFVSNYNEFRLFNPNYREKYISFKFKSLTDPEVLKKFLLIFSKFSLIEEDIPQTLLRETRIIERELEDEFYQLFSETRLMLIKELEYSSEDIDRVEAIRLAQLILNRYIFICFAEDLKLIPSETTADVLITPIEKKNLFEFTMWNRLNELFRFMDKGNDVRGIGSFNGGLFKEDLRNLEIRDFIEDLSFYEDCYKKWKFEEKYDEMTNLLGEYKDTLNPIYKNLLVISSFDFESELSVNILGHIFENSIGDIEELKDQTKERRKKDGVFYTPEYITDYICRNTIIPYLSHSGEVSTIHELISEYEQENNLDELDKRLKEIKIVDPACGSGAFLNKAVDVLFEIHEALHYSMYADDSSLDQYFDSLESRRQIISDNIYGVDLNEESVEITKLSLFLKLATNSGITKGFQLPNLDKNIKCGNSLIDDEGIVGNKAFKWKEEFKEIFDNGGFDVVVGNPPYIKADLQDEFYQKQRKFLRESDDYETLYEKWDYYIAFIEKGLKIFKKGGFLSLIISNSYNTSKSSIKSKEFISDNFYLKQLDFFKDIEIFKGVGVESLILTVKNEKSTNPTKRILHKCDFNDTFLLNEVYELSEVYRPEDNLNLDENLKDTTLLGNICFISKGMVLNADEKKAKGEFKKNDLISNFETGHFVKKYVEGKDLRRYKVNRVRYLEWGTDRVPSKVSRPTFNELYECPKLIRGKTNQGIYDDSGLVTNDSCYISVLYKSLKNVENRSISNSIKKWSNKSREELEEISSKFDLKYLQSIMNSKFCKYYLNSIRTHRIEYYTSPDELKLMPIKNLTFENQSIFISLVEEIMDLNKKLSDEIYSFQKWLKRTFEIKNLSNKLEKYYELDFEEFLKEIKKKKVDIKQRKTQELLEEEFLGSLGLIQDLQRAIKETDEKINQLVYELYELTEEEINIIEESLK